MKRVAVLVLILLVGGVVWADSSSFLDGNYWNGLSQEQKADVVDILVQGVKAGFGIAGQQGGPATFYLLTVLRAETRVKQYDSIMANLDAFYSLPANINRPLGNAFTFVFSAL